MKDPKTILITRPSKANDASMYTYSWGEKAVLMGRRLGYNVIDIRNEKTTYEYVSEMIEKHNPRLYTHFGHGCPTSLQGRDECIINKNISIEQLVDMVEKDPSSFDIFCNAMVPIVPLKHNSSCNSCNLTNIAADAEEPVICYPICTKDTNTHLLKDTITLSVACHSASQLGIHTVEDGTDTYIGFDDLLMFPVDSIGSQKMFGEITLVIFKELLLGATVEEANKKAEILEDSYIKKYKKIKYIALPMLWNKLHRKIIGNRNSTIYS